MISKEDCNIQEENQLFERFLMDVLRLNYFFVPDEINAEEDMEKFKITMIVSYQDFEEEISSFVDGFNEISEDVDNNIIKFNLYKFAAENDIHCHGKPSILNGAYVLYTQWLGQKTSEYLLNQNHTCNCME